MKTCTKCGIAQPESEFRPNGRGGLRPHCRHCTTTYARLRRHQIAKEKGITIGVSTWDRKISPEQKQLYRVWSGMRQRCSNRNNYQHYRAYVSRGIQVCERWQTFANFAADMGPHPGPGFQLDRIDNDGNYEPGNCRWVTQLENNHNRPLTKAARTRRDIEHPRHN